METITKRSLKSHSADGKLNIGLGSEVRKKIASGLNELLADEMTLYVKTLNFHWNLEGPGFHDLHVFLENQYNKIQEIIDETAERIRMIGHFANGSMKQFLNDTSLKEIPGGKITPGMLKELENDHNTLIRKTRELIHQFDEYGDAGNADFATQVLREHEKIAWMLHASCAG